MSLITALDQIDHQIPLSAAIEMTTRFRAEMDQALKPEFVGMDILPLCETFNRSAFDSILAQPGSVAVRVYLGMDAEKKIRLIFVGVNDNNEDILPSVGDLADLSKQASASRPDSTSEAVANVGVIMEEGQRCPPICPTKSPLFQP